MKLEHVAVSYAKRFIETCIFAFDEDAGPYKKGPIAIPTFFNQVIQFAKQESLNEVNQTYGTSYTLTSIRKSEEHYKIYLDGDDDLCSGYKFIQGAMGEIFALVWFSGYGHRYDLGHLIGTSHDKYARGFDMYSVKMMLNSFFCTGVQVKTFADDGTIFTPQKMRTMLDELSKRNLDSAILFVPTSKFKSKEDVLSYRDNLNKNPNIHFVGGPQIQDDILRIHAKECRGITPFWEYLQQCIRDMNYPWDENPVAMVTDDFGNRVDALLARAKV